MLVLYSGQKNNTQFCAYFTIDRVIRICGLVKYTEVSILNLKQNIVNTFLVFKLLLYY